MIRILPVYAGILKIDFVYHFAVPSFECDTNYLCERSYSTFVSLEQVLAAIDVTYDAVGEFEQKSHKNKMLIE